MREKKPDDSQVDMERLTLVISASLFMGVLAFFIVLNSYSAESASKMASVRNSLISAFGFAGTGFSATATDEEGRGQIGQLEEDFAASLRSILPDLGFRSRDIADGSVMSVVVPRAQLEEEWPGLQTRLGDLMVNRAKGKKCELQLLALDGPENAAIMAQYAEGVMGEGVSAEDITIGYESRGRDAVEIRFILRKRR